MNLVTTSSSTQSVTGPVKVHPSELERLAESAYGRGDPSATQKLHEWSQKFSSISEACLLLESSSNGYAQFLAGNVLLKLVPRFWGKLDQKNILTLRQALLQLVFETPLPQFVSRELIRLMCRITKIGFCKDAQYSKFAIDVLGLMNQDQKTQMLVIEILKELVDEIASEDQYFTSEEHSKVISQFRKSHLLTIFQTSLHLLDPSTCPEILKESIKLSQRCLTFKWYGPSMDETKEYISSIRIPEEWKTTISDPTTLQRYLWLAQSNLIDSETLSTVFEVLACISGCRQSLFSTVPELHENFVVTLLSSSIMFASEHVKRFRNEPEVYKQFTRMLLALKSTYKLDQLHKHSPEMFRKWAIAMYQYTLNVLSKDLPGSAHYLLDLWAQFSHSLAYSDAQCQTVLSPMIPSVLLQYIESRLRLLSQCRESGDVMGFFANEVVEENLHKISILAKTSLEAFTKAVIDRMSQLKGPQAELELAWWVMVAKEIATSSNGTQYAVLDAHLISEVLKCTQIPIQSEVLLSCLVKALRHLLQYVLSYSAPPKSFSLVAASIKNTDQSIGESETINLIINVLVRFSGNVLASIPANHAALDDTLDLLHIISKKQFLRRHLPPLSSFPSTSFLPNVPFEKRTLFFAFVGALLYAHPKSFESSISFLTSQALNPPPTFLADLLGILESARTPASFNLFHQWFQSLHLNQKLYAMPGLLAFLREFTFNRQLRLSFPSHSSDGIRIFKQVSEAVDHSSKFIGSEIRDMYQDLWNPLLLSMEIVSNLFVGGFVPFAALSFYNDSDVSKAFVSVLSVVSRTSIEELVAFDDLRKALYRMLLAVSAEFPPLLQSLSPVQIQFVLKLWTVGVLSHDRDTGKTASDALERFVWFCAYGKSADLEIKNNLLEVLEKGMGMILWDKKEAMEWIGPLFVVCLFHHRDVLVVLRDRMVVHQNPNTIALFDHHLGQMVELAAVEDNPNQEDVKTSLLRRFQAFRVLLSPLMVKL